MPTCRSQSGSWVIAVSGQAPSHMVGSLLVGSLLVGSLLLVMQLAVSQPKGKGLGRVQHRWLNRMSTRRQAVREHKGIANNLQQLGSSKCSVCIGS